MLAWIGFIRTWGLNADAVCAATYRFWYSCEFNVTHEFPMERTSALLCFTSFLRKRNWRLRFDKSIVSRSKRVISPNPVITTFFTGEPNKQVSTRKKDELDPRVVSSRRSCEGGDSHSSHPIPPAPTSKIRVFGSLEYSSGPNIAAV